MILNKRNTGIALALIGCIFTTITANAEPHNGLLANQGKGEKVTNEYSATGVIPYEAVRPSKELNEEISKLNENAAVLTTVGEFNAIAERAIFVTLDIEENEDALYEVPIDTAPELRSGKILTGEKIIFNIEDLLVYVDAEYQDFEWDTRKRIKDIYILNELLVNQLNVSPTKAAAIIGNVCYEDSFAGLTNSKANLENLDEAHDVLGNGNRGYGCAQWTAKYRQNGLEEYYTLINSDLSWELTSVVAETAYLYNELYVSGILGDLSEDGDLEHLTGVVGCEYEAYAKSSSEWYKENGVYKTTGSPRYTYAKHVYEWMCGKE